MATTVHLTELALPQQQRQGTFRSGSRLIAVDTVGTMLQIRADINSTDYIDPLNSLWVRVFQSADDGQTWTYAGGARWTGGAVSNEAGVNPMPTIDLPLEPLRGRLVQAEVDIPRRMRVGATVQFLSESGV